MTKNCKQLERRLQYLLGLVSILSNGILGFFNALQHFVKEKSLNRPRARKVC